MLLLQNIAVHFGHHTVLRNLCMHLFETARLEVIVGRSGSGKSSLLKCIAGLMHPFAGQILWNNTPVFGPQNTLIAGHPHIQMVHQDFQLPAFISVGTYLNRQLPNATNPEHQLRLLALVDVFKLQPLLQQRTNELSGGQQQRVAIAGALAAQPQLVLLDEPFSNLDPMSRQELLQAIQTYTTQNSVAILAVMHEPELALQLAERLHILHDGEMQASGSPKQLFFQPPNRTVAGLLGNFTLVPTTSVDKPKEFHQLENQVFLRPAQIIARANPNGQWQLKHASFGGNMVNIHIENNGILVQTTTPFSSTIAINWDVKFVGNQLVEV
jgi:ABC-type sugar transport system ATPase subunit